MHLPLHLQLLMQVRQVLVPGVDTRHHPPMRIGKEDKERDVEKDSPLPDLIHVIMIRSHVLIAMMNMALAPLG